jgi:hypothetical protein
MKRLLTILLLAAGTTYGQIDNPPTSVNIVDSTATGRAVLTATNAAAAATAIGLGATNDVIFNSLVVTNASSSAVSLFDNIEADELDASQGVFGGIVAITASGIGFITNTAAANTRTNLGLGATDNVTFSNITANGIIHAKDSTSSPATNSSLARGIQWTNLAGFHAAIYASYPGVPQITIAAGASNAFSDVATFRATGMTVSSNAVVGGTLAVSNTATFSTNVSIAGSLTVGSLATTTPSTWALDAVQTNSSGPTSFSLALPDNGNVIRVTNAYTIQKFSNGRLGAFYYLVNQSGSSFAIENTNGITVQGGKNLTLAPNEVATLVATGPTNVSVAARGDLTDVALGGTANTAPSQTASSGSSLMTRDLVGQEFANPRNKVQMTYWFGLEGQGYWTTVGTNATARQSGAAAGFGGGIYIYPTTRIGVNSAGAGLRSFNDVDFGPSPYRFSDGGALTMRARVRKNSVVDRPAFAFLMGIRTATQMWQENAYGIYFVPQPTNSWASNAVVTQHSRIAVSNVVWAVNTAGTNGATEPAWTDLIGSLVTNGSAVYVNAGPHTSDNWVLGIGSTNASQVVMTNTGKVGPTSVNRAEVVLKLRTLGTTNTPYTVYGSVEDGAGETTEVSLTTTNNDGRAPQFWSRQDETTSGSADMQIRYISIDGQLGSL